MGDRAEAGKTHHDNFTRQVMVEIAPKENTLTHHSGMALSCRRLAILYMYLWFSIEGGSDNGARNRLFRHLSQILYRTGATPRCNRHAPTPVQSFR